MRQNARLRSTISKRSTKMKSRRLSILDSLVAGKRFAYVGESDHFIHEKYAYRLAMLNYLAARGFTHVGRGTRRFGWNANRSLHRHRRRIAARARHGLRLFGRISRAIATTLRPESCAAASATRTRPRCSPPSRSDSRMACEKSGLTSSASTSIRCRAAATRISPRYSDSMPADADDRSNTEGVAARPGETIDEEIARLDEALKIDRGRPHSTRCAIRRPACATASTTCASRTRRRPSMRSIRGWLFASATCIGRWTGCSGKCVANEKLALMSHNMHLCRAPDAVAGSDAAAGPGGKTDPPLGAWLAARYPARDVFSVDADRTRPGLATVSHAVKRNQGEGLARSTHCLARSATVSCCRSTQPTLARGC